MLKCKASSCKIRLCAGVVAVAGGGECFIVVFV